MRRRQNEQPPVEEAQNDESRFQRYVDHANTLPLLTPDELALFASTGEYPTLRAGVGTCWMTSLDTQFVIRLRRTLLAQAQAHNRDGATEGA